MPMIPMSDFGDQKVAVGDTVQMTVKAITDGNVEFDYETMTVMPKEPEMVAESDMDKPMPEEMPASEMKQRLPKADRGY